MRTRLSRRLVGQLTRRARFGRVIQQLRPHPGQLLIDGGLDLRPAGGGVALSPLHHPAERGGRQLLPRLPGLRLPHKALLVPDLIPGPAIPAPIPSYRSRSPTANAKL